MTKNIDYSDIGTYYFSDTSFSLLMQKRIRKVLVICSSYDFFMLEEDGRIDEQIFNEYVSLNLRYPPVFIHADSAKMAFSIIENETIDLIIEMLSISDINTFELAKQLKEKYHHIPIVVLTHFSREVSLTLENEDLSAIDYVFCWLGNADLLLAIIKLIEDKMNAEFDISQVGVQAILFVEDSIRFISSYLPHLYKIVLHQSWEMMKEALNEHQKMLRRRGRPKILMAKNYNDAVQIFNKYRNNILGIISDVSYKSGKDMKVHAGLEFCQMVKSVDPNIPFLLQSSDVSNKTHAKKMGAGFLHKHSKNLHNDLRDYIISNFGFGDFNFKDPKTLETRYVASDLKSFQELLFTISDDILSYHTSRDEFSKWLNARALFPIAKLFKPAKPQDFKTIDDVRKYIYKAISNYRTSKAQGVIADFNRFSFDEYVGFSRIGEGSIGGKARGLAFINSLIIRKELQDKFKNTSITVPRSVVLSTEVFDEFMEKNDLFKIGISGMSDEEILKYFVNAPLPESLRQDLKVIVSQTKNPLAVRSSSKLEDSFYQPFAGIYNTYMVPMAVNHNRSLQIIEEAIKSVYASVYFQSSKMYMSVMANILDEEKMGIVIQEVCGKKYGNWFFPAISGVARSVNYYPVAPERSEEGIASIAYGLGKLIMEGGTSLRFSPKYPKKLLQLSSVDLALKNTQKYFYALDLDPEKFIPSVNDKINLVKFKISEAEDNWGLKFAASVYDMENNRIQDGFDHHGKKIITFSNVLVHNMIPLAEITSLLLEIGQKEMNNPIEIEFAVNPDVPAGQKTEFSFLQIRPVVSRHEEIKLKIDCVKPKETIIYSEQALGNGKFDNISHIVYVKPESFSSAHTKEIAAALDTLNARLMNEKKNFVLIGPGRWGSSDPWLGIPVRWQNISGARVIVESAIEGYQIEPSQGTHFFHNLTTFGVGYFTVSPFTSEGYFDIEFLKNLTASYEDGFVRVIDFKNPLRIEVDGRTNKGVIYKPGF